MVDSILNSVKKVLGLDPDYDAFDPDILMHINTVLTTLNQIGIGPEEGFMVEDDTAVWATFLGDDLRLNSVKTYVYLRVRLLFDPPQTSYLIDSMEQQRKEIEWRLSTQREGAAWTDPSVVSTTS